MVIAKEARHESYLQSGRPPAPTAAIFMLHHARCQGKSPGERAV